MHRRKGSQHSIASAPPMLALRLTGSKGSSAVTTPRVVRRPSLTTDDIDDIKATQEIEKARRIRQRLDDLEDQKTNLMAQTPDAPTEE
eukprot:TRINITY_DN1609_c0_g1_i1.p1 TRINITY_DN1609_c0_g1~~TRINITY_DN1609_c0_g1_i1.p1  ORF type:complete len:88 (+),score=9.20 TRINITY_DN1609_c0_g1_i1:52-315(+)